MVKVRVRGDTKKCFFDFNVFSQRVREYTALSGTKANIEKLKKVGKKIDAEIELGTFEFADYFPSSPNLEKVRAAQQAQTADANRHTLLRNGLIAEVTTFAEFSEKWFANMEIEWRRATKRFYRSLLSTHLLPTFGELVISDITRDDLLEFRKELAKVKSRNGSSTISNRTVNSVMTLLKAIMDEAAYRLKTTKVTGRIQKLRISRTKVQPFTLKEVFAIADTIHEDYRDYIIVRFFTGMRPSELHGLTWDKIVVVN